MIRDMVQEFKFGQITQNMKENGEKIKLMDEVNSGMQMVISMKENGRKIKLMVMVFIFMLTELNMKVTGKMISKTAKEWKAGKMVVAMKVATKKE